MFIAFSKTITSSEELALLAAKEYLTLVGEDRALTFCHEKSGRPFFKERNGKESALRVSVSHSGDYLFVAVDKEKCGIDIQFHDERLDRRAIASRVFGRELDGKKEVFFDAWALAEAHIKHSGAMPFTGFKDVSDGKTEGKILPLLKDYSVAVCGDTENVCLTEFYG